MKQQFAASLVPAATVTTTFLVQYKEQRVTASGRLYLALELQDSSASVRARVWDPGNLPVEFDVDDVVQVTGTVEDCDGRPQLRLSTITRVPEEEIHLADYLPRGHSDPEILYAALLDRVRQTGEGPLRALLIAVLEDPAIAAKYKLCPAATNYHHAYLGGLLQHVTSLLGLADKVCDHYSSLHRDMVVAGIVLHDLGKIQELSFSRRFHYSTRGQLLGHISIGMEMIQQKMRDIPDFPVELKDRLEHILLSHHGRPEWGSPKEPMFPEALAVHYLDDLDSKLDGMQAQYRADVDRPGEWTARSRPLGRELLKGAGVPDGTKDLER